MHNGSPERNFKNLLRYRARLLDTSNVINGEIATGARNVRNADFCHVEYRAFRFQYRYIRNSKYVKRAEKSSFIVRLFIAIFPLIIRRIRERVFVESVVLIV